MTYAQKLKDPKWQRKRLQILQRDNFRCVYCGDEKSTLHVHHEDYIGEHPWETPEYLLATLCEKCHSITHLNLTPLERILFESLRQRHMGDFEQIKIINSVVKRLKKNG